MFDAKDLEAIEQIVKQAVQSANQQNAQQAGQQVGQQIAEAQLKAAQAQGTSSITTEKEIGETGFSERYQISGNDRSDLGFVNNKQVVDGFAALSANNISQLQKELAQLNSLSLATIAEKQQIIHQAQQNANVNIDNLQKQHLAHRDIATKSTWDSLSVATDRIWNIDEQNWAVNEIIRSQVYKDVVAATASQIAAAMATAGKTETKA